MEGNGRKGKLPFDFSPRTKTSLVTSTHRLVITRRVSLERSALAFIPARTLTPQGGGSRGGRTFRAPGVRRS